MNISIKSMSEVSDHHWHPAHISNNHICYRIKSILKKRLPSAAVGSTDDELEAVNASAVDAVAVDLVAVPPMIPPSDQSGMKLSFVFSMQKMLFLMQK